MEALELTTFLLILASAFSLINLRLLKLPTTIGLMILAIVLSVGVLAVGLVSPEFLATATSLTKKFDFSVLLVDVMLPFLLFAGAISVNVHELLNDRLTILFLASFGVLFLNLCSWNRAPLVNSTTFSGFKWPGVDLCRLPFIWRSYCPYRSNSRVGNGQKNEFIVHNRNPYSRRVIV